MNFSISYSLGSFLFVIIRSPNEEKKSPCAHERHAAVVAIATHPNRARAGRVCVCAGEAKVRVKERDGE